VNGPLIIIDFQPDFEIIYFNKIRNKVGQQFQQIEIKIDCALLKKAINNFAKSIISHFAFRIQ